MENPRQGEHSDGLRVRGWIALKKERKSPVEAGGEEEKKRKIVRSDAGKSDEGTEPLIELSLVAMNGMVEAVQAGNRQLARNKKAMEKAEKALTEVTCMMGKVVNALPSLRT